LAEILLRKQAIKRCYHLPPHLINASAVPCETQNTEIISFHVDVVCWFANRHTSHIEIICWSFWQMSGDCCETENGRFAF